MKKIALLLIAAVAAFACQKPATEAPEITVKTTDLTIPVDGTEDMVVAFNAPEAWTAAIKETQDWCSIAPSSGAAGDASVTVIALENEAEEERSVTLVITAGAAVKEVVLTQEAVFIPRLTASDPAYIPLAGGTTTVEVTANVEYTATLDAAATWLTMTQEGNVLTFTAATANDGFAARSATVTFATDYEEVGGTVTVSQEGRATLTWTKIPTLDYAGYEAGSPVRMAMYGDYLLLANLNKVFAINPADGSVVNTYTLPEGFVCHSLCVDEGGNILVANNPAYSWSGPDLCEILYVYTLKSLEDSPRLLLKYSTANAWCAHTGNVRVEGNIDERAVVTAFASASAYWVAWEVVNGEVADDQNGWDVFKANTVPYAPGDSNWGCVVPNGDELAEGLWFVGYKEPYGLNFCADPINAGTTWTSVAETGNNGNWNTAALAVETIGGKDYALVMAGAFFNYADPYLLLFDVTDKSAATQLYKLDLGMFAARNADWSLVNYVNGATEGAHSDVLVNATANGINMYFADANFNMIGCVTIK
jgi:hypothetical protein